jgi:hypothetical protein
MFSHAFKTHHMEISNQIMNFHIEIIKYIKISIIFISWQMVDYQV